MKVTRTKGGYRINLSDAEFGMLQWLVVDGIAASEGLEEYELQTTWTPAEKAALTRRTKRHGEYGILAIDEDRRSPKPEDR